ncbi:hypothetical protein LSUE1_G008446, partial [Lachnellula suecica]
MSSLPLNPFTITGGCFGTVITYTLSIPSLSDRPKIPEILLKNNRNLTLDAQNEITARLPITQLDHCNSCRRTAGAIVQCWFVFPQSWMQFSLLPKESSEPEIKRVKPQTVDVIKGDEKLLDNTYLSHFRSSEFAHRTFCGRCGTNLTFHFSGKSKVQCFEDWPPIFDVAVGSMDQESVELEGLRPRTQ